MSEGSLVVPTSTALAEQAAIDALFAVDAAGEVVLRHDGSSPSIMRGRFDALVERIGRLPSAEHRELAVEHEIVDGMYLRKLFIPKGTLLVGKVHLKACLNIVAKGDISVLTEIGGGRFREGATAGSGVGTQKIGLAHSDTVFINVFRTDLTDIASIELELATEVRSAGGLICHL